MFKRKNKLEKIKGFLPYEIITQKIVVNPYERRITGLPFFTTTVLEEKRIMSYQYPYPHEDKLEVLEPKEGFEYEVVHILRCGELIKTHYYLIGEIKEDKKGEEK